MMMPGPTPAVREHLVVALIGSETIAACELPSTTGVTLALARGLFSLAANGVLDAELLHQCRVL
jgi:hypothetical protein